MTLTLENLRLCSASSTVRLKPDSAYKRYYKLPQTCAQVFVVPSFSRNAALFDCTAPFVVRVDLDNFTFASTLQDKVSAIRPPPTAMRGRHISGGNHTTILARKLFPISNPSFRMPPKRLLIFVAFEKSMEIILELILEIPLQMLAEVGDSSDRGSWRILLSLRRTKRSIGKTRPILAKRNRRQSRSFDLCRQLQYPQTVSRRHR